MRHQNSATGNPRTRSIGELSATSSADRRTGYESIAGISNSTTSRSGLADFGTYGSSSRYQHPTSSKQGLKSPSEGSQGTSKTRYASSLMSNGSEHTTTFADHLRDQLAGATGHSRNSSYSVNEEFHLAKPDNPQEIEAMFERVRASRGIPDVGNMTTDRKWQLVYHDEHLRWQEERKRAAHIKRAVLQGQNNAPSYEKGSPEWYLKKFMENTITPKQVSQLNVSLRTEPIR